MKIVVTGGAGFIGSHFVRMTLNERPDATVIVLDKLTYAGNLRNLEDVAGNPRYSFVEGDIADAAAAGAAVQAADVVVNFAAESHVDRSLATPEAFVETNVKGVLVMLGASLDAGVRRFVQVSTDEVYGSAAEGEFDESAPLRPTSPYSASKAAGDLMALSFHASHGLDVVITRGANTYGPNQYPEKLIPLFVTNALDDRPLPLYGDGLQVRDWLHVEDHCRAIDTALRYGEAGGVYNIGGAAEMTNADITRLILGRLGKPESLIRHVADRPGHDRRYALDDRRLRALGWTPAVPFREGLAATIDWYAERRDWWEPLKTGEYRAYYDSVYAQRLMEASG